MMVASAVLLPYVDLAQQVPGLEGIVHVTCMLSYTCCIVPRSSLWATQKENLQNLTLLQPSQGKTRGALMAPTSLVEFI